MSIDDTATDKPRSMIGLGDLLEPAKRRAEWESENLRPRRRVSVAALVRKALHAYLKVNPPEGDSLPQP